MNLDDIFEVALSIHTALAQRSVPHMFIGGIAIQAWAEPRVTNDVDLSVITEFGDEANMVDQLMRIVQPRYENAVEFALSNRVVLAKSESGIGVDIGLAAFPYEQAAFGRLQRVEFREGLTLPIVGPEDLLVMKVFAGRPQDWFDVRGLLIRQFGKLDWGIVEGVLPGLLELIEEPERFDRLIAERDQIASEFG